MHIAHATIAQEQSWNECQLASPVAFPAFRVWAYPAPAIVLGCSQRALLEPLRQAIPPGVDAVLRPSGGGAVLTGPWLVSASVVLPIDHPWVRGGLVDSYRGLGLLHGDVLAQWGIATHPLMPEQVAAANAALAPPVAWACFGSLAPWELTDGSGRKLVGLAQRRQRHGILLVAGTLVSAPDWALLCKPLGHAEDAPRMRQRTVHCAELSSAPPSAQDFALALADALARALHDDRSPRGAG